MPIDQKYRFIGFNPSSKNIHTEEDGVLFLAKDRAFLEGALPGYRAACVELGTSPEHLASIDLLIARVQKYQEEVAFKIPDTDKPDEIARCLADQLLNTPVNITTTPI